MYSLFLYLYQFGVFVASFFKEKVQKMWRGEQAAFSVLKEKADPDSQYLWFHAASLGEFEQARPIIESLKLGDKAAENGKLGDRTSSALGGSAAEAPKILLTFFSPSGYEVRKDYSYADIVCYLPIDTPTNARRFLSLINIKAAYFIKYEFWWNYLSRLRKKGVPVYSVSSIFRDEQIFFKWYGYEYRRVLKCFTHFFVQNEKSRQLLAKLGITNVTITGDTRFDRVRQIQEQAKVLPVVEKFIGEKISKDSIDSIDSKASTPSTAPLVFVAGSSWPPDEDIFFRYFAEHPEWRLIIAPHVIGKEHLDEIEGKLKKYGMRAVYYSEFKELKVSNDTKDSKDLKDSKSLRDVLIINCFGLLSSIYRYGDVAYVGGGFGVGIHNVLEAAVWGVPVFFGPNNKRFQEAQDLIASGGGLEIGSYDDFAAKMDSLIADPGKREALGQASAAYVASKCGATEKVIEATVECWP